MFIIEQDLSEEEIKILRDVSEHKIELSDLYAAVYDQEVQTHLKQVLQDIIVNQYMIDHNFRYDRDLRRWIARDPNNEK